MGVIEKSKNPRGWNSPILCVPKHDKTVRICVNFKNTLNLKLCNDSDKYTLPVTDVLFQEIGTENNFFASLDLAKGYWQIGIKPEDRFKTSFTYENETYCFTRLPFGLKNAGDSFCRAINSVFNQMQNLNNVKSYVDDVLVHATTFEQYFKTLEDILKLLRAHELRLNAKKCKFLTPEVKFLGRILNKSGYTADPVNVQAVKDLSPPKNLKQLQCAIGRFVWLREFISCNIGEEVANFAFSHILKELTKLNKKSKKFDWPNSAQSAFDLVKSRLSSDKIIYFADFSQRFCLVTDASNFDVAGILMRLIDGKQRIIATVSKTLSETEQIWSAGERECYAILFSVEKLDYFLKGPQSFVILTDHKALTF